jgi:hypothetical protein
MKRMGFVGVVLVGGLIMGLLNNPYGVLAIIVIRSEDNWHYELDDNGDSTGNLIIDDLEDLKSYDFYWLADSSTGFSWFSESVRNSDVAEYYSCVLNDRSTNHLSMYYNESSSKYSKWFDCYKDLTHHVAFSHAGSYLEDFHIRRYMGISDFRLICDAYTMNMIRMDLNIIYDDDFVPMSFGKILDTSFMAAMHKRFSKV